MRELVPKLFVFFSSILNRTVVDSEGQFVGRLFNIVMSMGEEVYPKAARLVVQRGFFKKEYAHFDWKEIGAFDQIVKLKIKIDQLRFKKGRPKFEFTLRVDILDQQVVDTDHQKVVRVNDIHLLKVDSQLYLAHVDVGIRGLIRRLGWSDVIDKVVKTVSPNASYLKREEFIPWKNAHPLTLERSRNVLRLDVERKKLYQIPPTELAEIMEDLDVFEKLSLFKFLDVELQRKVFADLATSEQEELIDQLDNKEASGLLENIPSDEAVDLLLKLPKKRMHQLMKSMETKKSKRLRKLLGFAQDSAGGLMTTEYLSLTQEATVCDALQKIKDNAQYPGNINFIYIVDEQNRLVGSTSIRRFINEEAQTPIVKTCYPKRIFVRTDDGTEEIALLLEKYKFSAVPVLDESDVLQGVVTIDDVMEELISIAWTK